MSRFKYPTLGSESDSIRVLVVRRNCHGHSCISCSLQPTRLSEIEGDFVAVSHVWGSDDRTSKILVNGQSYSVTPQLWQFLRLVAERTPGERLWIDAICIDQRKIDEKERQIPLMGQIYSRARKLVAWLYSPLEFSIACDPDSLAYAIVNEQFDICELLEQEEEAPSVLSRLLFHEYWSRIWIVQELRLSVEKEFWWEGSIISSRRLEGIATEIVAWFKTDAPVNNEALWSKLHSKPVSGESGAVSASLLDHMSTEKGEVQEFTGPDERSDLADLVCKYRKFRRTLNFDSVFALLGIIRESERFEARYDAFPIDILSQVWKMSRGMDEVQCYTVGEVLGITWSKLRSATVFANTRNSHMEDMELYMAGRREAPFVRIEDSKEWIREFRVRDRPGSGQLFLGHVVSLSGLGMHYLISKCSKGDFWKLEAVLKISRIVQGVSRELQAIRINNIVVRHIREVLQRVIDDMQQHNLNSIDTISPVTRKGRETLNIVDFDMPDHLTQEMRGLNPSTLLALMRMSDDNHAMWREGRCDQMKELSGHTMEDDHSN